MKKQFDKDINKYIKEIKSLLICDYKTRKKFISDIKSRLDDHIENGLVSNINDVYERMGTPRDIANAFFENADVRRIKRKMDVTKVVIIGVVSALIIWAAGVTAIVVDEHIAGAGYIVDELNADINYNEIIDETIGDEVE